MHPNPLSCTENAVDQRFPYTVTVRDFFLPFSNTTYNPLSRSLHGAFL